MVSIVCWLWNEGYREFLPKHVNVLRKMLTRHLAQPHRLICITNEKKGFDEGIEVMEPPSAAMKLATLKTPEGARFPSCYRRLWVFSEEAKCLGEQILMIDVDVVLMNDIGPVINRDVDFIGWRPYRDWGTKTRFGGGLYLLKTGTRQEVWKDFDGLPAISAARSAGFRGSDQAWISYKLGEKDPYFERSAGVYSIRDFANANPKDKHNNVPKDARIVQLNGPVKPWTSDLRWVQANWR